MYLITAYQINNNNLSTILSQNFLGFVMEYSHSLLNFLGLF